MFGSSVHYAGRSPRNRINYGHPPWHPLHSDSSNLVQLLARLNRLAALAELQGEGLLSWSAVALGMQLAAEDVLFGNTLVENGDQDIPILRLQ